MPANMIGTMHKPMTVASIHPINGGWILLDGALQSAPGIASLISDCILCFNRLSEKAMSITICLAFEIRGP